MRLHKYADNSIWIERAGPVQHFTPRFVARGVGEGWLSIGHGKLTMHTRTGDVVYTLHRVPGRQPDGSMLNYFDCAMETPRG